MIIAVDFDDTVCDSLFPDIIGEKPEAIRTLIDLQNAGHEIVIWTCRAGMNLEIAAQWLDARGFKPECFNENAPSCLVEYKDLVKKTGEGRKIYADVYIDDKNLGGFPGWNEVRKQLLED
jgi:hypothetical protein